MEQVHPLRQWRSKTDQTLAEVARAVGVVPSYISDIERYEKQPSLALAAKLGELAGIPIDEFVKREGAQ